MGMCKWFFQDAIKIQNGHQSVGAKIQKLKVGNYSNFTITFPTTWKCAGDFFKVLLKFEMAAMDKLHNFFVGAKTDKLRSVIIHILQSYYPLSGNVQVILLKFKITTTSWLFKYLCPQKTLIYGGDDIGLQASC